MRIILACASAIALAASVPALSQGNGGNRGGGPGAESGGDRGGGPPAAAQRGNRGPDRANRGNGGGQNRGQGNRPEGRGPDRERPAQAAGRGSGRPDAPGNAGNRGNGRAGGPAMAGDQRGNAGNRGNAGDRRNRRSPALDRFADNDFYRARRFANTAYRSRIVGFSNTAWGRSCPPGLARQNELCMPPGQYRKLFDVGARFDRSGYRLPGWYRAVRLTDLLFGRNIGRFDYRYADGYAYRLDPETRLVLAAIPVLGGALGLGRTLPDGYRSYNVPVQYRPVYRDGPYDYRYGANAIYRVDPDTQLILGVSELLASEFRVGQPVPRGYSVYNVPYGYRDQYYDTDAFNYRYNNGRIYRIDPETRLVLAAIDVLA